MKILVLGHKGMLGTALMERLKTAHEVTGKDIEDFDITAADSCREVIAAAAPEVVINAAAYTNVDGAESDEERCFVVNAAGVRNIAAACRDRGIKIVHFSTDYVFDGTHTTPYTEDDIPAPRGVYARSKAAGEAYLREGSDDYLLIRTAWLYGPVGKNFVKTILEKALHSRNLRVVEDQIAPPPTAAIWPGRRRSSWNRVTGGSFTSPIGALAVGMNSPAASWLAPGSMPSPYPPSRRRNSTCRRRGRPTAS